MVHDFLPFVPAVLFSRNLIESAVYLLCPDDIDKCLLVYLLNGRNDFVHLLSAHYGVKYISLCSFEASRTMNKSGVVMGKLPNLAVNSLRL